MLSTLANEISIMLETSRLMSRSLLLQESHHRIKNNLQMIISLLYIQKDQLGGDQGFAKAIDATVGRVKSIAAVHDVLCGDTYGSGFLGLHDLTDCVLKMYQNTGIEFQSDIEELCVAQEVATSVVLVLNELLSNCFKHAFTGLDSDYPKHVLIRICTEGEHVCLRVQDNGVGLPTGGPKKQSLGMTILHALVENGMNGRIFFENDQGTAVTVELPICNYFTKHTF